MTEDDFWRIIHESREEAGGTQDGQIEKLIEKLELLNEEELTSFSCHAYLKSISLNTWKIDGAFRIIYRDFCFSDDLFEDFTSAIIMQGKNAVAEAIMDPDSIKASDLDACDKFHSCPKKAWARQDPLRKEWFMVDLPGLTGTKWESEPAGTRLDDEADLEKLYPRLWRQFGNAPKRPPGT